MAASGFSPSPSSFSPQRRLSQSEIPPEKRSPASLSTETKAHAGQFHLFNPLVDLHVQTFNMLQDDPICIELLALSHSKTYNNGACYWEKFRSWVLENTPEGILDDPAKCPAVLIYLAFHIPDKFVKGENPKPDYELMIPESINDEWKQRGASGVSTQQAGRPSGGLLIMAAEMLIELKFQQKTTKHDSIIKTLLMVAAGFEHTPGTMRPQAYFFLGEMELSLCNEKNIQHLLFAFDFFISYLKFIPYKTKLGLREETIAKHTEAWNRRHPEGHPLMFWMENFHIIFYNHRLYRQSEYNPEISPKENIDISLELRAKIRNITHLKNLYSMLSEYILNKYLAPEDSNNQSRPSEDEQPLIPIKILHETAIQLMLPRLNEEMSQNREQYSAYLLIKRQCLFILTKLSLVNNQDIKEATVDKEGTLTLYPNDVREWNVDQTSTFSPLLTPLNTLIDVLLVGKPSAEIIWALMSVKSNLNRVSEIIGSAARRAKELEALKKQNKEKFGEVVDHFNKAIQTLLALAVKHGDTATPGYIDALSEFKLAEESWSQINCDVHTVNPQPKLSPSSHAEYKATASQIKQHKSMSLDKAVEHFLDTYLKSYGKVKYDELVSRIKTTKNPNPSPEDIILEALRPSKGHSIFNKKQNKTARLLQQTFGIDVSKPPVSESKSPAVYADNFFQAYQKVYGIKRMEEHTIIHVSAESARKTSPNGNF